MSILRQFDFVHFDKLKSSASLILNIFAFCKPVKFQYKIEKIVLAIKNLIHQPSLINLLVEDESRFQRYVSKKYPNQKGLPVVGIEHFIGSESLNINPYAYLEGGSLVTDMALLKSVCMKYNVNKYLEFGTWRGESVSVVSSVVENCTSVNLPDDEMREMGLPEEYINAHRFFSNEHKNITHLQANTLKINTDFFNGEKYDLIFVDADHHYSSVLNDTRLAFNLLKNEKSIIIWHDYAFNPVKIRNSVYAAILDGTPTDKINHLYHVSNTMCAIYIPETIKSTEILSCIPTRYFEINIQSKKIDI